MKLDFHTGIWESILKAALDLIEHILTRDVATRIAADEVLTVYSRFYCTQDFEYEMIMADQPICYPWILLYTDHTLRTLSIKSKSKSRSPPPPSQL
ncbi:Serine/threonine-protein kinase PEPKR2 [Camellia lanceoleosa]|uniref:Serine/threonine-protein kinase PEPKR2 n=1 Tax=Camellia lanceoleosa TaxID=1840588 RepID=A0ACC0HNN3_9ERIC|nr:Serine/threonine-protein kinase PEPKR2 [Camellia lanceoleosa]